MGGNDVIGHVKSFPRTFRRGAVIHLRPQLPSYDDRQPQGKEPKLSDLGVTRRNPDIVRDSEGPSGTAARALFPAGATGLTTPGGHGTLRRGSPACLSIPPFRRA